ncbi:purine nucleoside phosphorylase [Acrasis kona]|uniref:purine-nucleoside phosphorylase n=1 Tax=Acrasis kona TaxID=1008807 RepID=A0AAW2YYW8_9EUKA
MTEQEMRQSADYVRSKVGTADVAVILGSGLGDFVKVLKNCTELSYSEIPHMPKVTVLGHAGKLISGEIKGVKVFCFAGRFHSYEGIGWTDVCFQVRLMANLGCKLYIVTNSAGGVLDGMRAGCLCLMDDHARYMTRVDPLKQFYLSQENLERSRETHEYWNKKMVELTMKISHELKIQLFQGAYLWTSGPSYETPLEVRNAQKFGGATVGMSTVPEVVAAHAYGMAVMGISMVSNLGAGLQTTELTHQEVLESSKLSVPNLMQLLEETIARTPEIFTKVEQEEESKQKHQLDGQEGTQLPVPFHNDTLSLLNDIQTATLFIQSKYETANLQRALFKYHPQTTHLESTHIKLDSLQGYPSGFTSGQSYLTVSDDTTLTIHVSDRDGFSLAQSSYLSLLLYTLKIQTAVVDLHGERLNDTLKSNMIKDVIDFTADTQTLQYLLPIHPHYNTKAFLNQLNIKEGITYMAFEGPSKPSLVEMNFAKHCGADVVGTTSVSLLYTLHHMGLNVYAKLVNDENQQEEELDIDEAHIPIQIEIKDKKLEQPSRVLHLSFDEIDAASRHIQQSITNQGDPPISAVIDFNLNISFESSCELIFSIPSTSIPHFEQFTKLPSFELSCVRISKNNKSTLLYVVSTLGNHSQSHHQINAVPLVRLLQNLNVKNIFMTSSFVCCNDSIPKDAVVVLSDHVNLTGDNSLTGHNEQRWGDRFFDMTKTYDYNKIKLTGGDVHCDQLYPVQCLFLNHARVQQSSTLLKSAFETFGCEVIGDVGCMESIAVKHTVGKLRCAMLGVAFDADKIHEATVSEKQSAFIVELIQDSALLLSQE